MTDAGPLFDAALNITAAMIASTAFILATGKVRSLACDHASLLYLSAGGVFENIGVLLVIVALGFGDVSVVSPLSATAPLFVLVLALLFPSDVRRLTWRIPGGVLLIVVGVLLLTGLKAG